jgi:hypothetical protein
MFVSVKAISYCIAQTLLGVEKTHEHVGMEPSGVFVRFCRYVPSGPPSSRWPRREVCCQPGFISDLAHKQLCSKRFHAGVALRPAAASPVLLLSAAFPSLCLCACDGLTHRMRACVNLPRYRRRRCLRRCDHGCRHKGDLSTIWCWTRARNVATKRRWRP